MCSKIGFILLLMKNILSYPALLSGTKTHKAISERKGNRACKFPIRYPYNMISRLKFRLPSVYLMEHHFHSWLSNQEIVLQFC